MAKKQRASNRRAPGAPIPGDVTRLLWGSNRMRRRVDLYRKQKGLCYYCEEFMAVAPGQSNSITIDHVRPLSKSGHDVAANRVGACWRCNMAKGNMAEAEFRKRLRDGYVADFVPGQEGVSIDSSRRLRMRVARGAVRKLDDGTMTKQETHELGALYARLAKEGDPEEIEKYPVLREALAEWYFRPAKGGDDAKE